MGEVPPYLVLLRVGFALPAALLPRRCALTAPFHPYPGVAARAVYFLWHFPSSGLESTLPDVIRHTALRSSDFPLSSLTNKSGHPAQLPTIHYMRRGKTLYRRAPRELRKNKAMSSRSAARDLTTACATRLPARTPTPGNI